MEQNRDRGNIKWTSLMLPEHLERLREWQREDQYTERPDLTDFELQEMQQTIETAWKRKCETVIKTWREGKVNVYQGVIEALDPVAATVSVRDPFGTDVLYVAEIIDAELGKDVEGI